MKWLVIPLLLWATPAFGQGSFTAASCNQSDVNAVINGPTHTAVDGDTINIPSGTCTWTNSGVTVPSGIGITIIGTGTPNSTSSTRVPSASCTATTITLAPTSTTTAFFFRPSQGNSTSRWSCMQITYSSGPAIAMKTLGTCTAGGCPNLRVDNVTFTSWAGHTNAGISFGITAVSNMFGVWDHNLISGNSASLNFLQLCECNLGNYLGTGNFGDYSWNQPENYGSNQFMFFENNTFNNAGCCENEARVSSFNDQGGGRIVVRFNTFKMDNRNSAMFWHGTESNGRPRGGRTWEFYANTGTCVQISGLNCGSILGPRSGTGLSWGNSNNITGAGASNFLGFNTYRAVASIGWGPCDGSSVWDVNDGTTYYSDTVASYNSGTKTITVSGSPGWSANQWSPAGAPYSVHDVTKTTGSEITANGSNTLTINVGSGGPGDWSPAVNDSIQILRATACVDQGGGRGAGILYSGQNGSVPTSPLASSAEVSSPSYLWANPWVGGTPSGYVGSNTLRVIANRDWYSDAINQAAQSNNTTPFNGSSGTGYGTYANHPTSCTNGTAYWAEDQGSWNTTSTAIPGTGSFTQGQLYICSGGVFPVVGSPSYVPFTYPHPLISGGGGSPTATFTPNPLAMGQVPIGMTSNNSATVTLQNTGTANLVVTAVTPGAIYALVNNTCGTSFTLTPGASCTFQVTASPFSAGPFSGGITFSDNAGNPDVLPITGQGTASPAPAITIFAGNMSSSGTVVVE